MRHRLLSLLLVSSVFMIYSCQKFLHANPEYAILGGGRVTEAGANQLIDKEFEKIDLVQLLDPNAPQEKAYEKRLRTAVARFYEYCREGIDHLPPPSPYPISTPTAPISTPAAEDNCKWGRNLLQNRIMAASDQRCNLYKIYITRLDSHVGFIFGALGAILGGLGAILTNEGAIRALAGSAGITSGVNAAYSKAFFAITVDVVSKGIDKKRRDICIEIRKKQQDLGIGQYDIYAAVMDALEYNGACSMLVGIQEAGRTLDQARAEKGNPQFETMRDVLQKSKVISDMLKNISPTSTPAPNPNATPAPGPSPTGTPGPELSCP